MNVAVDQSPAMAADRDQAAGRWQRPVWIALVLALLLLYVPTYIEIVRKWFSDEYSAHGLFIPIMVGALLWWKRQDLKAVQPQPMAGGFLLLGLGLILQMGAWHLRLLVLTAFSLVPTLLGLTLLLAGPQMLKLLWFPIAFLFFTTPLPRWFVQPISLPIQTLSANTAFFVVENLGIPLKREGFSVALPNVTVEVAESCSGFKKTVSLIVFTCFYAMLFAVSWWRQGLLIALSVPIAILANVVRVVGLILAGSWLGSRGVHLFHDFSEIVVIGLCFVLIIGVGRMLGCQKIRYFA